MDRLIKIYGIEIEPEMLKYIPEEDLKEICRLLFLSVSKPVARVKQILREMESNPEYDYSKLKGSLAIEIKNQKSILKDNFRIFYRVNQWVEVFDTPGTDALEEIIDLYETGAEESDKIRKLGQELKIQSTSDIKILLDKYVIGQEEAKKTVSFVFYLHLLRNKLITPEIIRLAKKSGIARDAELPKPNIVLIGPTGSGKTLIISQLCKIFNIPFLKVDCSSLVSSGYVGNNLNDSFYQLLSQPKFRIEDASKAIIYFDEFDKISESQINRTGSVGGVELQQEFLSLIENDNLSIRPHYKSEQPPFIVPSSNIMFVFSGSFAGMERIIMKRMRISDKKHKPVGFKSGNHPEDEPEFEPLLHATHVDLIEFGIIPELVSRVNFIVPLHKLTHEEIITIIKHSAVSPLPLYENFFRVHFDELIIEEEVFQLLAEEVLKKEIGARAIDSVMHYLLKDYLFESPDGEAKKYVITPEYFRNVFGKMQ